ncbi:MAG: hypothetical protein CMP55_01690, partial [Flavobacteriales bacterium]|nr:hypothetical protein [Flavobacteriales bacterium]
MIFLFSKLGVYNKLSLLIFTLFSFTFFSNNIYSQSDFSPVVDVSLSNLTPGSLSDLSFTISQDANESDMSSSIVVSNGGSFSISSLSVGDLVGFGSGFVAGGTSSGNFSLYVSNIVSSSQATLLVIEDSNSSMLGSFTIKNAAGGIQILSTAPNDGNSITAGNSQQVTLSNIFNTPNSSSLTISTTIYSEMNFPAVVQSFSFNLQPPASFSPFVVVSLSNLVQSSLSDLSFTISQDANESDMSSSVVVSNGGSFVISSLNIGDNVGFGSGFVGGGSSSGAFNLIVSEISSSSEATLNVIDLNNDTLGSFNIQNTISGIQILSTAPSDGNEVTAGNSQEVTLSNIFLTPNSSSLTITTTINAEMDFPSDIQIFNFNLEINCNDVLNSEFNIVTCDSYEWNGSTYTSSGSYTYNTQTVDGCDSTATLNL